MDGKLSRKRRLAVGGLAAGLGLILGLALWRAPQSHPAVAEPDTAPQSSAEAAISAPPEQDSTSAPSEPDAPGTTEEREAEAAVDRPAEETGPPKLRPSGLVTLKGWVERVRPDGKTAVIYANDGYDELLAQMTDDPKAYQNYYESDRTVEICLEDTDWTPYDGWSVTLTGVGKPAESPEQLCPILFQASELLEAEDSRETLTKYLYEGGRALTLQMYGYGFIDGMGAIERIDIYEGTRKIQTIREPSYSDDAALFIDEKWENRQTDLNFDGYADLQFRANVSGTAGTFYHCYLWNPLRGQFEFCEQLSELAWLEADPATKTLKSRIRRGPEHYAFRELKWRDGAMETVALGSSGLDYPLYTDFRQNERYEKRDGVFVKSRTFDWNMSETKNIWLDDRPASPYEIPALAHPQIDTLARLAEYRDLYEEAQALPAEKRVRSPLYSLLLRIAYEQNEQFLQAGGGIGQADLAVLRADHLMPEQGTMDPVNSGRFARCADMEAVARWLFDGAFRLTLPDGEALKAEGRGDGIFYTEPVNPIDTGPVKERYRIFRSIEETEDGPVLEALICDIIGGKALTDAAHFSNYEGIGYVSDDGTVWFYDDFDPESLPRRHYTFYRASDGHYMAVSAGDV